MNKKDLENLECGIVATWMYTKLENFERDFKELEENPDFTLLGHFDSTQAADEELQYQGFTLEEITKMSLRFYGNVIEVLEAPDTSTYWVFVGAR